MHKYKGGETIDFLEKSIPERGKKQNRNIRVGGMPYMFQEQKGGQRRVVTGWSGRRQRGKGDKYRFLTRCKDFDFHLSKMGRLCRILNRGVKGFQIILIRDSCGR